MSLPVVPAEREELPVAFRKEFSAEMNIVEIQVVEKVHKSGRKDRRVLLLSRMKGINALFLCTMDGVIRRVLEVANIDSLTIMSLAKGGSILTRKHQVPQLLIRNTKEDDVILNLIHHKYNSVNTSIERVVTTIDALWREARMTTGSLPIIDLRDDDLCNFTDLTRLRETRRKTPPKEIMKEWMTRPQELVLAF
eukprot:TRINITY_DN38055_c0_g1_i1.p1 TRINITY_DN38055_c0_g1~~TRINITY_DN38055_c0_g1_i1.p1  ORF type:complete len:194 (+),score=37.15 TRINITY_DN38055_c0_g1_i1:55-636(+)